MPDSLLIDKPYSVLYRKSKSARVLRLAVTSDSEITVFVPRFASSSFVERFLREKESWILKHLEKLQHLKDKRPSLSYEEGSVFYFLGQTFTIKYLSSKTSPILFKEGCVYFPSTSRIQLKLRRFLKERFQEIVEDRLPFFESKMNLFSKEVSYRVLKSRWGSCSSSGKLTFNILLLHCPLFVIDYVIVHELSHLKHMNHSSSFWKLVEKHDPNYKQAKLWLKQYGVLFIR